MIKTENLTILFVDIAGFTATTSRQSRAENARLLQNFGSTLLPLIKNFKGRLIKTIGDALLITFRSPTDAMLCSMALQDAMHGYNLSAPEGEKIHIRVAANLGEVRVTKNDIFGEPVNVASRIEGVAPADEIYLSEAVYMAMNKAEVPAMDVGSKELAGVAHPVRLYNIPRFSTHRLVPENANAEEKGSELLYPYGGMHYQVRPRSFASMLFLPDRKRVTHVLIPALAVCVIAFFAVLGYQYYRASISGLTVTMQSEKDESQQAGTGEMQQQGMTEEPVSAKPEVQVAALADKSVAAQKDVTAKAAQKSATVPDSPAKSTGSTWAPQPETVKEKTASGTWAPQPETVKEKAASGTWAPEPETVKEKAAVSTWAPEPETIETHTSETVSDESEKVADDIISAPITYAAKESISDWNITKAKQAVNSAEITKTEYNRIVSRLKTEYDKKIRQLKLDLNRGKITRAEYDQAVLKAKQEYSGR